MKSFRFPIVTMYNVMVEFYKRFDLLPPTKLAVAHKLQEETDEFIIAMRKGDADEITDEASDVMCVIIGGLIACGLDENDLLNGMYRVMAKNAAKTKETHVKENGTINKR